MTKFLKQGWHWPAFVVLLLAVPVVANLWLLRVATADPGFAVEKDYYRKAVAWDAHVQAEQRSAALGWRVDLQAVAAQPGVFTIDVRDRAGQPVQGAQVEVRALHNGHAAQVFDAKATPTPAGYQVTLPLKWPGLHEFRFTVTRGADVFTQVLRQDVAVAKDAH